MNRKKSNPKVTAIGRRFHRTVNEELAFVSSLGDLHYRRLGRSYPLAAVMMDRLSEINAPIIREVRGLGLMVGIELKQKVAPYLRALQERRTLALPAGMTVIRLLPPLVITYPQLDSLVEALADVLSSELKDE